MSNDQTGLFFHPGADARINGEVRHVESVKGDYATLSLEIGGLTLSLFPANTKQALEIGRLLSSLGDSLQRVGAALQPKAEG